MMPDEGFYRRPLPPTLVPFASAEGRALFREALAEGNLEGWFALAEQFHTQADPAFCGLGTLVVALNALGVDPGRLWKGPWRWYSEELLDCCLPLEAVRSAGITLDQFSCLARCNGVSPSTHRASDSSVQAFRADLRAAAASSEGPVLVISYSRAGLGQTGDGHFSPVAGFHAERDLALVLDVARFKYPPHWVPVPMLWAAMLPPDPATGRSRGWATLRRRASGSAVFFRLSRASLSWPEVARRLRVELPAALVAARPQRASEAVGALTAWLATELADVVEALPTSLVGLAPEHRAQADALLDALRATALCAAVSAELAGDAPAAEAVTALVLALPDATFDGLAPEARAGLDAMRGAEALSPSLHAEVGVLREQLEALAEALDAPLAESSANACCR
ncbi:MAG: phytochelatin synthase family protein [Deltaproteobacteria bacterium]|nr:phytochelatin synthase family protein [Myxococcales bacterium]MDP3216640.1 phytochelatin synthase family protein [Deltaproteobacteria bacterium]